MTSLKKMILVSGSGDTVAWFRIELLQEFINMSYKVYVLAPDIRDELKPALLDIGVEFLEIKLHRKGFNISSIKYDLTCPLIIYSSDALQKRRLTRSVWP